MPSASNSLSADQITRPFVESTQAVFASMMGCSADLIDCQCCCLDSALDLSGIIDYSGAICGSIVISLDRNVAFSMAEMLLGTRPETVNADVRDTVGELANLIGGNAKERLNNSAVTLGLPSVISRHCIETSLDPNAALHKLCFSTPWGPVVINLALRQVL